MKTETPTIKILKTIEELVPGEILISDHIIRTRIREVALDIAQQFKNKDLIVVGLLQGARTVTDELEKCLLETWPAIEKQYITARSYIGLESMGKVKISGDGEIDVTGKEVLLTDDICDTGLTLTEVKKLLLEKGARSVTIFALILKEGTRKVNIEPDFIGFNIPNVWIQGFGMDTDGQGRENPNIIVGPYYEEQAILA